MTQDSAEERRRKHMAVMDDKRKIEELLPDDLYDSKDWRQGDMAERVLWLIAMLKSKSEEVDAWVDIANNNVTKLAKAIAALDEAIYFLDPDEEDIAKEAGLYRIVTTYKELKENAK